MNNLADMMNFEFCLHKKKKKIFKTIDQKYNACFWCLYVYTYILKKPNFLSNDKLDH